MGVWPSTKAVAEVMPQTLSSSEKGFPNTLSGNITVGKGAPARSGAQSCSLFHRPAFLFLKYFY